MFNLFSKLIDANRSEINRLSKVVQNINALEPKLKRVTDKGLKDKTLDLKKRYEKSGNLEEILEEAFALVREASLRVNKQRHFDVQLISALALHEGKIA